MMYRNKFLIVCFTASVSVSMIGQKQILTELKSRWPVILTGDLSRGPCHLGGVGGGGVTPPKKVKKGGPTCGEGILRGKFWRFLEKSCFAKDFGIFCFRKNNVDLQPTTPPPPVANIFRKNFCFPENFFGGALEWKGVRILEYTPPTGNRLARPCLSPVILSPD